MSESIGEKTTQRGPENRTNDPGLSGNDVDLARSIQGRAERTRHRLGGALIALVQEKPFDTITVQDVLDRANVSRATFYTHFRDQDDLFLSQVDEFLDWMA